MSNAIAGHYIKISKVKENDIKNLETLAFVPYNDPINLSSTQQYFQPIKEMFSYIGEIIASSDTVIGAVGSTIVKIQDIIGVQLGKRKYYSQAWKGSEPFKINVTLKFFVGMREEYNARDEVYTPARTVFANTLPTGDDSALISPGPSGLDVFTSYASAIFGSIYSALSKPFAGGLPAEAQATQGALQTLIGGAKNTTLNKTWTIDLGYSSDGFDTGFKPYLTLKNLVVETASIDFSPQMQMIESIAYPISANVSLALSSSDILIYSDIISEKKS